MKKIITEVLIENTIESKIAYQGDFLTVAKDKVIINIPDNPQVDNRPIGINPHNKNISINSGTNENPRTQNQLTAIREYIKHPSAAAIIAITNDNKIVITAQYRYAVQQTILEIPAGKLDPQEVILTCAKRELKEETGYIATKWIELGTCLPCIGYSDEKITYFLAQDLHYTQANPDEGEFIETQLLDLDDFVNDVFNGTITDSKTICGIMLYLGYIKKIKKNIA